MLERNLTSSMQTRACKSEYLCIKVCVRVFLISADLADDETHRQFCKVRSNEKAKQNLWLKRIKAL